MMDITFKDSKFKKLCSNHKALTRKVGNKQADKIAGRLNQLHAATVLEDLRHAPGRCHELIGDGSGLLSLDLVHPDRLIFESADEPVPTKPDGGLEWRKVESVEILGIRNTHG